MPKYLLDPIKSFEEIRNNYILYLKTAFGSRFKEHIGEVKSFEEEREELLLQDQVLCREPWIEPIPSYKKILDTQGHDRTINDFTSDDFPGMDERTALLFQEFISTGLMSYPLYLHQYRMLRQSLEGKDCVITSGTGSGKTECFMWPMISSIMNERSNSPDSWSVRGVRALILYPMNALVSDQLSRLRKMIGDENGEFHKICDELRADARYPQFGMYTGRTPYGRQSLKNCFLLKKQMIS